MKDYKKFLELKEKLKKMAEGGQVEESQQKQYQAKDYFGKGSNAGGEGVANSQGVTMATGGWAPEQLPKTSMIKMPGLHSPLEKKNPINIPKAPKLTIPKRLRPVGDIRGYDEGGDIEEDPEVKEMKTYNQDHYDPNKIYQDYKEGSENYPNDDHIAPILSPKTRYNMPSVTPEKKGKTYNIFKGGEVKGYDDGGSVGVSGSGQEMEPLEAQYGIENYNARESGPQAANSGIDATVNDIQQQSGLLDRINQALGDKDQTQEQPEDKVSAEPGNAELPEQEKTLETKRPNSDKDIEESAKKLAGEEEPSEDKRNLEGITLSKNEALQQNPQPESEFNPIAALKDAQDRRNQVQMWNQLGAIAERGAAGYAGIKPTQQEAYKTNIAIAQQAVSDVKDRIAQQGDDPNSQISQSFRKYLEKFSGQPVDPNTTANTGKTVLPIVFKDYEARITAQEHKDLLTEKLKERKEEIEAKKEIAKEKNETNKQTREDKQSEKQEQHDVDRIDKVNTKIVAAMANSRSAFGTAAKNRQAVDNVKALLEGQKDYNDLDNRQVVEVARVLDRVLSGGQATISGSEHLTPESSRQWLAKKLEYITSQRKGAGAGSFVKTMADTLDRERAQSDKQIKEYQGEFLGPIKSVEKNDKDSRSYQNYVNMLKSNHLNALLPKDEQEEAPKSAAPVTPLAPNEVKRMTKDGRTAIFDSQTKKFLRYE